MRHILLLLRSFLPGVLFILYGPLLFSQNTRQIRKYYTLVNKAELAITDRQYKQALHAYQKAARIKNLYSYDAHNALLCTMELGKYEKSVGYVQQLEVKKGIPRAFFAQRKFEPLRRSKEWAAYAATRQPAPAIDTVLRKKIDDLLVLDQKYRGDNLKYADSINLVDSIIRLGIKEILQRYGYPSEDITGVWMRSDSTFYLLCPFDILLLHAVKNGADDLAPTLLQSIRKGDMHPLKFVVLSPYFATPNTFEYGCSGNNQVVYVQVEKEIFTCCCEREKEVDRNRNAIFLEPVADLRKKIEFNTRIDRRFKLNVSFSTSYLSYSTNLEEARQKTMSQKDFILFKTLPSNTSYY